MIKDNLLISVIVPVYNAEKYLEKCINSILNQTYKNLEIILVDDGSTDSSPIMCDTFSVQDCRIKVIHKKNGGQGSARNCALDIMTGDYVSFIDSDDWIENNMYENLLLLSEKFDFDFVQCGDFPVTDSNENITDNIPPVISSFTRIEAMKLHLDGLITQGPCNKLYKRELWRDIRFPLNRLLEDAATTYLIVDKSSEIVITTQKMYYVRCDMNSVSRRRFNIRRYDIFKSYLEMESFLSQKVEYASLVPLATEKKIGALFYILGELYKNKMVKENTVLVNQIINNCREIKKERRKINFKQSVLMNLILLNPYIFGFIYKALK